MGFNHLTIPMTSRCGLNLVLKEAYRVQLSISKRFFQNKFNTENINFSQKCPALAPIASPIKVIFKLCARVRVFVCMCVYVCDCVCVCVCVWGGLRQNVDPPLWTPKVDPLMDPLMDPLVLLFNTCSLPVLFLSFVQTRSFQI